MCGPRDEHISGKGIQTFPFYIPTNFLSQKLGSWNFESSTLSLKYEYSLLIAVLVFPIGPDWYV